MLNSQKSTRFHERLKLKIPLEVYYNDKSQTERMEETTTEDATICGLGFTLSQTVEPRKLIRFKLPMPKELRLFDYVKPLYEVWGNVRYLRLLESEEPDRILLRVGVALIGSHPPKSFTDNPNTLYDLKPFLRNKSFWEARELPRMTGKYVRVEEERREMTLKLMLKPVYDGKIQPSVEAETINVSESGAAVVTKLAGDYPNYVLLQTEAQDVSLLAAVRGVYQLDSSDSRLHLEFLSGKWQF